MGEMVSCFPRAVIVPVGSSYFPIWRMAWKDSPLADVDIAQFAAEAFVKMLGARGIPVHLLEGMGVSSTILTCNKFWTSLPSDHMGHRVPCFHMEQACASSIKLLQVVGGTVQSGSMDVVGALAYDRTSNSPVEAVPVGRDFESIHTVATVWKYFGWDPATGKSMIATAGNAARKYKLGPNEVNEITLLRYHDYFETEKWRAGRVLFPFEILDRQGRSVGWVKDDVGVRKVTPTALATARQLDTCVSGLTQTHPSDGMSAAIVTTPEIARKISPRPEICIQLMGVAEVRTDPAMMPEAPALAVQKLLGRTGLTMKDMNVVKSHNPFALNDAIASKVLEYDWDKMNKTGCSLVYGHPQAPTLLRTCLEAWEECIDLGGGYVLVFGCAAGDVGIASIFKVTGGGVS